MEKPLTSKPHPWRWMVFCARFFWAFITFGNFKAMGVFLPNFMDGLSGNTTAAPLAGSFLISMGGIVSPLVGDLMHVLDPRKLTMIGGVISASCLCCAASSQSMLQLGLWFAVSSLALSVIQVSIVKPLVDYFPDNFAAVNGVTFAGGTMGIVVIPPVMEYLVSMYGWRCALVMLGAFSFNYVLCGALLRPLGRPLAEHYKRIPAENNTAGSEKHPTSEGTNEKDPEPLMSIWDKCWHIVMSDESYDKLATRKFLIFQAMMLVCGIVFGSWHLFVIPQGAELRFGSGPAAYLAIFAAVGSLIGQLTHGAVVDRGLIRAPFLIVLSSLVFAASCLVNPLAESSYVALAALNTVGGITIGIFYPLTFVVLTELAGDRYMSGVGWLYMYLNIGQIFGGILSVWIRDVSGSSGIVFVAIGAFAILMAGCQLFIDCLGGFCARDKPTENTAARESE